MNHLDAGRYWNENADVWTKLSRAGFDVYRDLLNTPAFLAMLPAVSGLAGLDVGCGEGHNTRLLAARGARMAAIDVAEKFVAHAVEAERAAPLGIDYRVASAVALPFADECFDFATAFMSLMDLPETERALGEAFRVLKPGGFFQFSITHPCFDTPHRKKRRRWGSRLGGLLGSEVYAVEVADYFRPSDGEIEEWIFGAAPLGEKHALPKFKVPRFRRTLSQWLNLVVASGFGIEASAEPQPSAEALRACPRLQTARLVPEFWHLRVRKPR